MERSEAIGLFVQSEGHIKRFLEEIKKVKENRLVFLGTTGVKVQFEIIENVDKIVKYVLDGKADAERLKSELLNLRSLTKELQDEANQKGFRPFAYHCETIIKIIDTMERFESNPIQESTQAEIIHETGNNECPNIGEDSGGKVEPKPLTTEEIKEKLKKVDPFVQAKENEVIPYSAYYQRLTNWKIKQSDGVQKEIHVIDIDKCDLPLFESCVKRADISDIFIEGSKMLARLFMYYVAAKFSDSDSYKKAAAKAFGLDSDKTRLSGVPDNYRADFYKIMWDLFPESKPK